MTPTTVRKAATVLIALLGAPLAGGASRAATRPGEEAAARQPAPEPVYWEVVDRLMEEAFERSEVMDTASWLIDVFRPRNSKSSGYVGASEWARDRLEQYGLSNARLEPFEFGVGWENKFTSVHMMAPQYMPMIAYPAAWSAGTHGKIRASVVHVDFESIASEAELEQYRGRLDDRILLIAPVQEVSAHFEYLPTRFTDEELDGMAEIPIPLGGSEPAERRGRLRRDGLSREAFYDFVFAEGALAVVRPDGRGNGHGIVDAAVNGYSMTRRMWETTAPPPVVEVIVAAEHYNRIVRILDKGIPVEMEIEIEAEFSGSDTSDTTDTNVIAELPGSDLAHEIVIIGAHLQSEPVGTGAIDDASGVASSMEAMRILKAIGVQPRRTIRVGLWGGHEMGSFGNRSHVAANFADVNTQEYKADYNNFSGYFNMDIGTGRIRGISTMGNEELRSIFLEWMKPLRGLGFTHLYPDARTHEAYSEVGLLSFYLDQDRRQIDDMNSHTNQDLYERLEPKGLMQAAVVMASLAYHAAMRNEKLPRTDPRPW